MTISVVIPAFNEEKYIGKCLKSVLKAAPKELLEIIVVDNGSSDDTVAVARRHKNVTVLTERKKGPSAARQRGLLAAKGDIVAFIDADTVIPMNWFVVMRKAFHRHPKTLAITGPLDFYDLPEFQRKVLGACWMGVGMVTFAFTKQLLCGANFAAKRKAMLSIGGFDTSIRFYSEDTNMARRIKQIGELRFLPDFVASTSARRIKSQGLVQTSFVYGVNFFSEIFLHKQLPGEHKNFR